jgi:hypothetical protein
MKVTKLKGGSLSSTSLYEDGEIKFIRKHINTKNNREYGYVRWYSQLKKLQRLGETGLFPKVLGVGIDSGAYFDIEYLKSYRDVKTIFTEDSLSINAIEKINNAIWHSFDILHKNKYNSNKGACSLYFNEEVLQKLSDALTYCDFCSFYESDTFEYNGRIVYGIQNYLQKLKNFFDETILLTEENIHGNPTLENMMYSFEEDKVMFVDPYEESCIDSQALDYSQVLQCSRSYYGYINDRNVIVDSNSVQFCEDIPINFKIFNDLFETKILKKDKKLVDILEATQFIRMLPFKCATGNFKKAKFFYTHACHLLNGIF